MQRNAGNSLTKTWDFISKDFGQSLCFFQLLLSPAWRGHWTYTCKSHLSTYIWYPARFESWRSSEIRSFQVGTCLNSLAHSMWMVPVPQRFCWRLLLCARNWHHSKEQGLDSDLPVQPEERDKPPKWDERGLKRWFNTLSVSRQSQPRNSSLRACSLPTAFHKMPGKNTLHVICCTSAVQDN